MKNYICECHYTKLLFCINASPLESKVRHPGSVGRLLLRFTLSPVGGGVMVALLIFGKNS